MAYIRANEPEESLAGVVSCDQADTSTRSVLRVCRRQALTSRRTAAGAAELLLVSSSSSLLWPLHVASLCGGGVRTRAMKLERR